MNFLTKKVILSVSLVATFLLFFMMEELRFCEVFLNGSNSRSCPIPSSDLIEILFLSFVIGFMPMSLLTLPLSKLSFHAWKVFAVWAVPMMIVLVYFILDYESNNSSGFMNIDVAPTLIGIIYSIYLIISLLIISVTWYKTRNK